MLVPEHAGACKRQSGVPIQAAAGLINAAMEASTSGRGTVFAACGSKNTGKSSFARLLANCCLNWAGQVAWLDADPGQPEFTVPGDTLHRSAAI